MHYRCVKHLPTSLQIYDHGCSYDGRKTNLYGGRCDKRVRRIESDSDDDFEGYLGEEETVYGGRFEEICREDDWQ